MLGLFVVGCFLKENIILEASETEEIYKENLKGYDILDTYKITDDVICTVYGMEIAEEKVSKLALQEKNYRKIYDIRDQEGTQLIQIWEQTKWKYGGDGSIGEGIASCISASSWVIFQRDGVKNINKNESVNPGCYYCEISFEYNGRKMSNVAITTCDIYGTIR